MTKPYTDRVPETVRKAMSSFTEDDCFLVKRRTKGLTGKGIHGNCHFNVQNWVDTIGGERISGWLLYRNRSMISKGLWIWSFHSVWKTPEGAVVDVTQDATYNGSDYTTVWFDKSRDIDVTEGTSYNNVVVFETTAAANEYERSVGIDAMPGTAYWTTPTMRTALPLSEHSGKYRWIDESFPNNIKLLEQEYNCKITNGKLVPNDSASNKVSTKIFFDYSVGG